MKTRTLTKREREFKNATRELLKPVPPCGRTGVCMWEDAGIKEGVMTQRCHWCGNEQEESTTKH